MSGRRRSRVVVRGNDFWQSYGDLAMGLMAVFVFILLLLLDRQGRDRDKLEQASRDLQTTVDGLDKERTDFALELLQLLDSTYSMVTRQDAAEDWLRAVFSEGECRINLDEEGTLRIGSDVADEVADIYVSGETSLSTAGQSALASCVDNFRLLANCMTPIGSGANLDRRLCRAIRQDVEDDVELAGVEQFRDGIEALVLEGTTDRRSMSGFRSDPMKDGTRGAEEVRNYTLNARLGAERARLAMAFLLNLVRDDNEDEFDTLPVLMSRLRIETSSYGKFLAGPLDWREGSCLESSDDCTAARRLSLRVRWKKSELRRPYDAVRTSICARLSDDTDPFTLGLVSAGQNIEEIRMRYACNDS